VKNGCVTGIGIDLVENERMRTMLRKWGQTFKDRVFLKREQRYCDSKASPFRHYAGRFAVKEAVSKAFGTGVGPHIGWLDIEVVRDEGTGAPSIKLGPRARKLAALHNVDNVLVSLSHTKHYAVAQAVLAKNGKQTGRNPGRRKSGT
jgi:holo-[acyl-carrier protein] synthase